MGAILRAAERCLGGAGLDRGPPARLRARLWLRRGVHAAIGGARAVGAAAGKPPRGPLVLLYHRVSASRGASGPTRALEVPVGLFRAQMEHLRKRFRVVSLEEVLDSIAAGRRESSLAAVTFDDGYRETLEVAHPVLRSLRIPAAVFAITRWLGEEAPLWWHELEELARRGALEPGRARAGRERLNWGSYGEEVSRLKALPEELREARLAELRRRASGPSRGRPGGTPEPTWAPRMLSAEDLRAMDRSGLWTIGGHTHSHPILARLPLERARTEVLTNKRLLEEVVGHPIRWFAYPNGGAADFAAEHVELLRDAGYAGALSGISPWEEDGADPFRLPRLPVSGLEGLAEFRNHLAGLFWPPCRSSVTG